MLFADSVPDPKILGDVLQVIFYMAGSIAAVVVAAAAVLALLKKTAVPREIEYVTRGEIDKDFARIDVALARIDAEVKATRDYTSERTHALGNKLHVINLRMVHMGGMMTQVCAKLGIVASPEPQISAQDEV